MRIQTPPIAKEINIPRAVPARICITIIVVIIGHHESKVSKQNKQLESTNGSSSEIDNVDMSILIKGYSSFNNNGVRLLKEKCRDVG